MSAFVVIVFYVFELLAPAAHAQPVQATPTAAATPSPPETPTPLQTAIASDAATAPDPTHAAADRPTVTPPGNPMQGVRRRRPQSGRRL